MAGVSITLRSERTHSTGSVATTREDGSFVLSILSNQSYELVITYMGYTPKKLHLPSSPSTQPTLNPITLSPQSTTLQEVTVTARKKLIHYEADKLIYQVADDPESTNLTTFEILRKIPMLTIDGDDNIAINGKSHYQVLLNNRPSSLFVNNVSDAFKSLPAGSVKSIEIITHPSARYEAEGVGGIINIITHRKNVTGYSGSVRGGFSTPGGPSVGGSVLAKAGKLGLSGLWGYTGNTSPTTTHSTYRLDKVNQTALQQTGENRSTGNFLNLGGELSWQPNDLNLLTMYYNTSQSNNQSLATTVANMTDANGVSLQSYRSLNTFRTRSPGHDWGIDYQLSFKKSTSQLLTVSYKELSNSSSSGSDNTLPERSNSSVTGGHSENDYRFTEQTAQLDYTQPLKKHSLEAGVKAIWRFNASDYFFDREDAGTGLFMRDPSLTNQYTNRQDIYAGYVSLSLQAGPWLLRVGARAEQTHVSANFQTTGTRISQSYFNIIPNSTLSRRFGNATTLSVSYSQRLQRPGLYYLNPYVNNLDPYNISYGNPTLGATVNHVADVTLSTFVNHTNLSVNLNHSFTDNAILRFTTIGADTVARTTYGNIGTEQNSGITVGTGFTFFRKLSLNLNSSLSYRKYTTSIDRQFKTTAGFTYRLSTTGSYSLGKTLRAGMSMAYNSSTLFFQGRTVGFFTHSSTLNYSFLKNRKANLALSLNSPFQLARRNHTVTELSRFYMVRDHVVIMRRYTLTLNYRFGKLQGGIKRKRRGIANDDLLSQ
ncbi:outer membrane beta-barrel family protein [Nibrella saemangeumensis]|uniref:Outer membrane beta-barrel family protein n=1 Tax=Nibrella saemangeumensis TaxID=1084526 RepID=A0ABP8MMK2_9BACT